MPNWLNEPSEYIQFSASIAGLISFAALLLQFYIYQKRRKNNFRKREIRFFNVELNISKSIDFTDVTHKEIKNTYIELRSIYSIWLRMNDEIIIQGSKYTKIFQSTKQSKVIIINTINLTMNQGWKTVSQLKINYAPLNKDNDSYICVVNDFTTKETKLYKYKNKNNIFGLYFTNISKKEDTKIYFQESGWMYKRLRKKSLGKELKVKKYFPINFRSFFSIQYAAQSKVKLIVFSKSKRYRPVNFINIFSSKRRQEELGITKYPIFEKTTRDKLMKKFIEWRRRDEKH